MIIKDVLIKYYSLDAETRELLPFVYIYGELLGQLSHFKNVNINSLSDEETLMYLILFCTAHTTLNVSEIIHRILEAVDSPDVSVIDLDILSKEELFELLDIEPLEETEDNNIAINVFDDKEGK